MIRTESTSRSVSPARWDVADATVWLLGEHDLSTISALSQVISVALAHGDVDFTIDLSEVSFIDAATIGVIVQARELLRAQSRTLVLRSPSRCVQRLLELCHRSDLLKLFQLEGSESSASSFAPATWAMEPAIDQSGTPVRAPSPIPVIADLQAATLEPAGQTVA